MFDMLRSVPSRLAARRSVRADCQVVRVRDFKLVAQRTLDLSTTGMLVVADEHEVALHEEVIVSFRAPRCDRWVDAEGRVTRVIPGRRRGDVAKAIGLSIECLDRASFTHLRTALRRLPETRPRIR